MCLFVVKQTRYPTRVNAARDKRVQHFFAESRLCQALCLRSSTSSSQPRHHAEILHIFSIFLRSFSSAESLRIIIMSQPSFLWQIIPEKIPQEFRIDSSCQKCLRHFALVHIPQRSVVMQRILVSLNTSAFLLVSRKFADHHHNSHPRGTGMISTRIGNNAVDCFVIKPRRFHTAYY